MVSPTFLQLNLAEESFEIKSYEELISRVGGIGWGLPLFEKFTEEEPIVFTIGPLSALFPGAAKVGAVFRSPQTGGLMTAFAGGQLARFMQAVGYQGIVILGKASRPTFFAVDEEKVDFSDASPLRGLETSKLFERIFASAGIPGRQSVVAAGSAAEQGLGFSPLYLDEFFSFPRGGLGRAFALKNLKGFSISGEKGDPASSSSRYKEVFNSLLRKLKGYRELSELGTLRHLAVEKKLSAAPVRNLSELHLEGEELLAPRFARKTAARRVACGGCPVGCIHLLRQDEQFTPYDYEGVVALGPLLGLERAEEVSRLLGTAWERGLDPTSLGAILAYLTEKEGLEFGNLESYLALTEALLAGKEGWARELQNGLPYSSRSLVLGGLEFLPYFNGYASILSQIIQFGATTEENRGFWLDLDFLEGEIDSGELVSRLVEAEKKKILSQLLIGCGYLGELFEDPATAFAALEALGTALSHEQLTAAAESSFTQKLVLQKRLGFRPQDVKIPEKFFKVPSPQGLLEKNKLAEMVELYVKKFYEPAD